MCGLQHVGPFLRVDKAEGKAPSTLRNHYRALQRLNTWLLGLGLTDGQISASHLAAYINGLRERYPPDQINNEVSALRLYFRWLFEAQARPDNPAAGLRFLRADPKPVESLTPQEVRRLLSFLARARELRFGTYRTAVLTICLIDTGLRLGEALRLCCADLDIIEGRVHVIATKTRTTRWVPVSPTLRRHLGGYLRRRAAHLEQHRLADCGILFIGEHGGPWTVANAERSCRTVGRLAGLSRRVYPHLYRHTFATLSLLAGAPLSAVMLLGGWRKLATVQRYTHMSAQQLADVQAATSPLGQAIRLQFVLPEEKTTTLVLRSSKRAKARPSWELGGPSQTRIGQRDYTPVRVGSQAQIRDPSATRRKGRTR
jgi:site-specific recombinase XerD